jgi:two-component system NtrC family sensor kinase
MLSAGVAHEINNPLSSILANVGNAISESVDPEAIASLRVVESETLRIARIVRQLLDFSAPRPQGELGGRLPAALRLRTRWRGSSSSWSAIRSAAAPAWNSASCLDPDCPDAAISARTSSSKSSSTCSRTPCTPWTARDRSASGRGRPAASVEISVADSGPGIPEGVIARIFDPFFTTGQPSAEKGGAGLGLGLSVAYGIVTKRGGSIRVTNEKGGGANFIVVLPAARRGDERQR